jgi:hypothetical protein
MEVVCRVTTSSPRTFAANACLGEKGGKIKVTLFSRA